MRKTVFAILAASALALTGTATTANAAVVVTSSSNLAAPAPIVSVSNGITTINFGQDALTNPFSTTFSFMTDGAYTANFRATTSTPGELFTSGLLTGPGLPIAGLTFSDLNTQVISLMGVNLLAQSTYTLTIGGGGVTGAAYTGNGTLTPAVPEPATWALMLLGFGAIGMTVRRRRSSAQLPQIA
jgi:hypothetical protein